MEESTESKQTGTVHTPVLLKETVHALSIAEDDVVVDGTLGGGGHARAILQHLGENGVYLGIDADEGALERAKQSLGGDARVRFSLGNFRDLDAHLDRTGLTYIDKLLLDIGVSSDQLEAGSGRGFSFSSDEPLKMTFKKDPKPDEVTAWDVVNTWSESSLADIIFGFGGEHRARRIARAICDAREAKGIFTSKQLADIVELAVGKRGRTHPATKTFQAIRIAVNDELGALEEALQKGRQFVRSGGRMAVITFHSLEDRKVKRLFREWEEVGYGTCLTKKPIAPSTEECRENRRARSAKLRCFVQGQGVE